MAIKRPTLRETERFHYNAVRVGRVLRQLFNIIFAKIFEITPRSSKNDVVVTCMISTWHLLDLISKIIELIYFGDEF